MVPVDPFGRGLLVGSAVGTLATVIALVLYEVTRALRARGSARPGASFDVRAERVRLLREECRRPSPDYPRAGPDDDTRPMAILVERGEHPQ